MTPIAFVAGTALSAGMFRRARYAGAVPRYLAMSQAQSSKSTQAGNSENLRAARIRYACASCGTPARPLERASCDNCGAFFNIRDGFLDMVPPESTKRTFLSRLYRRQNLFQSPLVSFLYERGWRNAFRRAGFPGPDAEYDLAATFFLTTDVDSLVTSSSAENNIRVLDKPKALPEEGNVLVDLSCGSGLMARRFAASRRFDRVLALDLSAAMLQEALQRAADSNLSFDAVRADVSRLPFESSSITFAHAGASLHCWSKLQDALSEVFRVLKPGGRFFATTFLKASLPVFPSDSRGARIFSNLLDQGQERVNAFRYFDKDELYYLLKAAGFRFIHIEIRNQCAIVRCIKDDS